MQAISIKLQRWLAQQWPAFDVHQSQIELLTTRKHVFPTIRHFRITAGEVTQLIVDMSVSELKSEPKEGSKGGPISHHHAVNHFADVLQLQADAGLNVSKIIAQETTQGFLLLTDIGGETYLQTLTNGGDANSLLRPAGDALICWQQWQPQVAANTLPIIDAERLGQEMQLFADFYLAQHLRLILNEAQQKTLTQIFSLIATANVAEQQTLVHGDFVLENLLVSKLAPAIKPSTGAAFGPISLDIACLYKDAFLSFEEEPLLDGTIRYWEKAKKAGLPVPPDFGDFYRHVEWMGLQRHLYLLGAFARQYQIDGDVRYLDDAQRFVSYIRKTGERYTALFPLVRLFDALKIDDGLTRKVGVSF